MATLDIRGNSQTLVYDKIQFSEYDLLAKEDGDWFYVRSDNGCEQAPVYLRDIDNLILALQKAKELWGDK